VRLGGIFIGILFLVSGWLLALAALVLLSGLAGRVIFVIAAVSLQLLGLGLFAFSSRAAAKPRPNPLLRSDR
jgi:hypothetical protein